MNVLFDARGPVSKWLNRFVDLIVVAVLTTVCCLPIFTIGAAVSAMYNVMIHMALDREKYIVGDYFKSFGKNFKKATLIWLICLAFIVILGMNIYALFSGTVEIPDVLRKVMIVVSGIVAFLFLSMLSYVFAIQARFENKVINTMKNALFISLAQLPRTVAILVVQLILAFAIYLFPALFPLFVILEFSFISFFMTLSFLKVFGKFGDKEARGEATDEEIYQAEHPGEELNDEGLTKEAESQAKAILEAQQGQEDSNLHK